MNSDPVSINTPNENDYVTNTLQLATVCIGHALKRLQNMKC